MPSILSLRSVVACALLWVVAAGCGGRSKSPSPEPVSAPAPVVTPVQSERITLGGEVNGLQGSGLVLQNNGRDDLTITGNGSFFFPVNYQRGSYFEVTVRTLPVTNFPQKCSVTNGTGTSSQDVSNVQVKCRPITARYVYVGTSPVFSVTGYSINPETGALKQTSMSPNTGHYPISGYLDPSGRFMYFKSAPSPIPIQMIAGVTFDATTGALTKIPNGVPGFDAVIERTGVIATVLLHPNGKFMYVAFVSGTDAGVYAYSIDQATGRLTQLVGSPYAASLDYASDDSFKDRIAIDRQGRFLYLAVNGASGSLVRSYSINATTGELTFAKEIATPGLNPVNLIIDPSGKFLYATNLDWRQPFLNSTSGFTLNATTGLDSLIAGSPFPSGAYGTMQLFDTLGRLYVVNQGLNFGERGSISAYNVDATTGALTPITGSPFSTNAVNAQQATIDPSGKFIVVAHLYPPNQTAVMSINSATGALAPVPGSPFAESGRFSFDPSGRYLYFGAFPFSFDPENGRIAPVGNMGLVSSNAPPLVIGTQ